jgi:hypothetical protein
MKKLSDEYARPAAKSLSRMIDRMVAGQYPRFFPNVAGQAERGHHVQHQGLRDRPSAGAGRQQVRRTGGTSSSPARPKATCSVRSGSLRPTRSGDNGEALRKASLGHKLGFDFWKSTSTWPTSRSGNTVRSFQINLTPATTVGDTSLVRGHRHG